VGSQPATMVPCTQHSTARAPYLSIGRSVSVCDPKPRDDDCTCPAVLWCAATAHRSLQLIHKRPTSTPPSSHTHGDPWVWCCATPTVYAHKTHTPNTHHGEPHAPVAEHGVGQQLGRSPHGDALAIVQLKQTALQDRTHHQHTCGRVAGNVSTCRTGQDRSPGDGLQETSAHAGQVKTGHPVTGCRKRQHKGGVVCRTEGRQQ
jgi:hypothetical protein